MNRRTFLKRAAAFGAVLALPTRGLMAEADAVAEPECVTGGVITQPLLAYVGEPGPETIYLIDAELDTLGADIIDGIAVGVVDVFPEMTSQQLEDCQLIASECGWHDVASTYAQALDTRVELDKHGSAALVRA